jgi:hypothetical protein
VSIPSLRRGHAPPAVTPGSSSFLRVFNNIYLSAGAAWHGAGAAVCCCVSWSAISTGEKRFDASRPPRTHSRAVFEPFTRSNVVRAAGSAAHDSCRPPPATAQTAGCTSAMRGWRSPVDGGPSTTIVRFMERRRRACASASRWVSRGTGAHEEPQHKPPLRPRRHGPTHTAPQHTHHTAEGAQL